jgi:hypothetical protein
MELQLQLQQQSVLMKKVLPKFTPHKTMTVKAQMYRENLKKQHQHLKATAREAEKLSQLNFDNEHSHFADSMWVSFEPQCAWWWKIATSWIERAILAAAVILLSPAATATEGASRDNSTAWSSSSLNATIAATDEADVGTAGAAAFTALGIMAFTLLLSLWYKPHLDPLLDRQDTILRTTNTANAFTAVLIQQQWLGPTRTAMVANAILFGLNALSVVYTAKAIQPRKVWKAGVEKKRELLIKIAKAKKDLEESKQKNGALLFRAVLDGDEDKVTLLLDRGVNLFWRNDGRAAVPESDAKTGRFRPQGKQYENYSALELASELGHKGIVHTLVVHGAAYPCTKEMDESAGDRKSEVHRSALSSSSQDFLDEEANAKGALVYAYRHGHSRCAGLLEIFGLTSPETPPTLGDARGLLSPLGDLNANIVATLQQSGERQSRRDVEWCIEKLQLAHECKSVGPWTLEAWQARTAKAKKHREESLAGTRAGKVLPHQLLDSREGLPFDLCNKTVNYLIKKDLNQPVAWICNGMQVDSVDATGFGLSLGSVVKMLARHCPGVLMVRATDMTMDDIERAKKTLEGRGAGASAHIPALYLGKQFTQEQFSALRGECEQTNLVNLEDWHDITESGVAEVAELFEKAFPGATALFLPKLVASWPAEALRQAQERLRFVLPSTVTLVKLGMEISEDQYKRVRDKYEKTKPVAEVVVNLEECDGVTEVSAAELGALFPDATAVFLPKRRWAAAALKEMKQQLPAAVKLLALGAEISEEQYSQVRAQYERNCRCEEDAGKVEEGEEEEGEKGAPPRPKKISANESALSDASEILHARAAEQRAQGNAFRAKRSDFLAGAAGRAAQLAAVHTAFVQGVVEVDLTECKGLTPVGAAELGALFPRATAVALPKAASRWPEEEMQGVKQQLPARTQWSIGKSRSIAKNLLALGPGPPGRVAGAVLRAHVNVFTR